jgi:hypothetical protein
MTLSGAQYQIILDDRTLPSRDDKAIAIETAKYLKALKPSQDVSVRDLTDGSVTVIEWESGRAFVR